MNIFLLHQLLDEAAAKFPGKKAVIYQDQSISYADLERKSNQLAGLLIREGIKAGDRVGVMFGKSIESIVCIFGILKAGACYVPIDPSAPQKRVIYILRNCEIMILVTSEDILEKLGELDPSGSCPSTIILTEGKVFGSSVKNGPFKVVGWKHIEKEADTLPEKINISDAAPAYILHTSGSTGLPKGVVISHINALTFVKMASEFFKVTEEDRLCNHAPLYFDLSMFDIYVAIKCGATVVLVPEILSVFPIKLAEYIDNNHITIWNSVSSVLSMLAIRGSLDKFKFPSLRLVIFSGEILPVKYLRILKNQMGNTDFYNIYGQTEANSSTYYKVSQLPENDIWKIPIGNVFPNFEIFLIDENGKIINSPGEEGEIHVKGSTVANGYWRDEVRTRERFIPDPRMKNSIVNVYKTGDLARFDGDRNLVFSGRKDHLIKSRGYRIELEEIETVLNSHPSVKQAVVIPIPDELIGNKILSFITSIDGNEVKVDEILSHCKCMLPKYMIPEIIQFVSDLPKTPSGKIDRKALLNMSLKKY